MAQGIKIIQAPTISELERRANSIISKAAEGSTVLVVTHIGGIGVENGVYSLPLLFDMPLRRSFDLDSLLVND